VAVYVSGTHFVQICAEEFETVVHTRKIINNTTKKQKPEAKPHSHGCKTSLIKLKASDTVTETNSKTDSDHGTRF
jgi:hypothetical protein